MFTCAERFDLFVSVTGSSLEDLDYEEDDYDYTDFNSTANGTLQFVRELINVTRDPGRTVKLICEVKNSDTNATNSKVTFNWLKFGAPIPKSDRRISVKQIHVIVVLDLLWFVVMGFVFFLETGTTHP